MSINSYAVFTRIRYHGRNAVVFAETEEYFRNGDIVTVTEYHFSTVRGAEFGWARVQSDDQHLRVIGDRDLLEKYQVIR